MSLPGASQQPTYKPPDDSSLLMFDCAACAKKLKIKSALAGKKIKCPRCGQIMVTPLPTPAPVTAPALWRLVVPPTILAMVLWATFILKLYNLDHTDLTRWDEVFHAVVAQNVSKHPLKPTLVDTPYLSYNPTNWNSNHVWLHKPILPFWQVALSFALFGVSTFTLRLPAAVLSTGAALFTYLIGARLIDRRAGLVAATLQAINPFIMSLVHGYQFADNIDVALLFWVEVGIYFLMRSLKTGSWRDVLLAGVAQGLAFLCKSHLAFIILGLALTAWLLPYCRLAKRDDCRIGVLRILAFLGMTLLTIAPWFVYCAIAFPEEFWHEQVQVLRHLNSNVEQWAAPWDRVVFDYMIAINGVFYTPAIVAAIVLVGKAVRERHAGVWLLYAWALGVIVPHVFAVTKTPSATLLALPALLLLLGCLVSEATRGKRMALAALAAVLLMSLLVPAVIRNPGWSYNGWRQFGDIMRQSLWVIGHVAGALALATPLVLAWMVLRRFADVVADAVKIWIYALAMTFCIAAMMWLTYRTVDAAWAVNSKNLNDPYVAEVGDYARHHLPENAVLLCDVTLGYEHLKLTFYADRVCYSLGREELDAMGRQITEQGGVPYIVSRRRFPFQPVYTSPRYGPVIYPWQPRN